MAEHESRVYAFPPAGERISVLEIKVSNLETKMDTIVEKLDELLEIKHKGMGAIGLVSVLLVAASGIAGVITFVLGLINHR